MLFSDQELIFIIKTNENKTPYAYFYFSETPKIKSKKIFTKEDAGEIIYQLWNSFNVSEKTLSETLKKINDSALPSEYSIKTLYPHKTNPLKIAL